jgi:hypothetical protein
MVWAGIVLSLLLFIGVGPLPVTIALYLLYLSLDTVGQTFYNFQWDALLLEVGFAAVLVAPAGFHPSYRTAPSRAAVWVFRFLLFRLMFESGVVKLVSGDPTWRNLTALSYHYETQPLPTPIAWYAHQLPMLVQKISTLGVFVVELIVPFLFFAPRRLRLVGAWMTIALQLMIAVTGNYTFFNLLTILRVSPGYQSGAQSMERLVCCCRADSGWRHSTLHDVRHEDYSAGAIQLDGISRGNVSPRQSLWIVREHDDVASGNCH